VEFRVFSGLRKFKAAVYCVWSCHALQKLHSTSSAKTFSLASIGAVPYENRFVRHLVDSCAFHIYGHWVKRGEEQNRALLFETAPKKLNQIQSQALSSFTHPKSLWAH
jgi:phosphorylase kinase gamma subunit